MADGLQPAADGRITGSDSDLSVFASRSAAGRRPYFKTGQPYFGVK